eukprot:3309018-Amphidinium_carterae.1
MDSGRGQIAPPRLDQRMLEDMNEPHMPTIHENVRVDPLTVDDPWTRGRNVSHAAGMSVDEDFNRSRSRQFHGNERPGFGSEFPIPMPTTTYDIYTPRDDAVMPQASMVTPNYQSVSHPYPPGFPPTIPSPMLQQHMNMDVESGIFIESGPQMWYPPSTHQQGYIQGRQQITHFPVQDQGQGPIFSMAPPEPRPMTQEVGFQASPTMNDPRVHSRPIWGRKGDLILLTFRIMVGVKGQEIRGQEIR